MSLGGIDGGVGHLPAAAAAVGLGVLARVLGSTVLVSAAAVAPGTAIEEPLPATLVAVVLTVVVIVVSIITITTAGTPRCDGSAGQQGEGVQRQLHCEYVLKLKAIAAAEEGTVVPVSV